MLRFALRSRAVFGGRPAARCFSTPAALDLCPLSAISAIDGRYGKLVTPLRPILSEYGLIRSRCMVEVKWLQMLSSIPEVTEVPAFSDGARAELDAVYEEFSLEDAQRVKEIESVTRHDVKAVEYFLKEKLATSKSLGGALEFIHFACTSEDMNNLAYGSMLSQARAEVVLPAMDDLIKGVKKMAHANAEVPMLSRTHGQPATPTTLGKELANFGYRLSLQRDTFAAAPIKGKFAGAVGNYNPHYVAYPTVDWQGVAERFVTVSLGSDMGRQLVFNPYTTQIEPHDFVAELFDAAARFNTVLLDMNRDMWSYISLGYFKQKAIKGEIGSSTMPHKVNPIDFENSEGNIGIANSIYGHFGTKLPISRYQRDLSDSTVMRSIGVGMAHSLIAYKNALAGLGKVQVNKEKLEAELDQHWEVLAEPIQTVMRRYDLPSPYEQLKDLTRGKGISKESIREFVGGLEGIPEEDKQRLMALTPASYLGAAADLARKV